MTNITPEVESADNNEGVQFNVGKKLALVAILGAIFATAASAQGPSVEETIDYINTKLSLCPLPQRVSYSAPSTIVVETYVPAVRESLVGNYEYSSNLNRRGDWEAIINKNAKLIVEMDLREVLANVLVERDPYSAESRFHKVFNSSGTLHRISVQCETADCMKIVSNPAQNYSLYYLVPEPGSEADGKIQVSFLQLAIDGSHPLLVCQDDALERVEKALLHLLRLSGAKEELF